MSYKVTLHDDRLGFRIAKQLHDDWWQDIFSIRPWVIWTRRGSWGHARPGRKERKESDARVLAEVLQSTGPWQPVGRTQFPDRRDDDPRTYCSNPHFMRGIGGPPDPTPPMWVPCYECDGCLQVWAR